MRGAALPAPVKQGMCTVVPVSYLTHFSVSGETLASINSSLAPRPPHLLTEIWSLFLTPKRPLQAGGARSPVQRVGRHRRVGTASLPAPFPTLSWLVLLFTGVI